MHFVERTLITARCLMFISFLLSPLSQANESCQGLFNHAQIIPFYKQLADSHQPWHDQSHRFSQRLDSLLNQLVLAGPNLVGGSARDQLENLKILFNRAYRNNNSRTHQLISRILGPLSIHEKIQKQAYSLNKVYSDLKHLSQTLVVIFKEMQNLKEEIITSNNKALEFNRSLENQIEVEKKQIEEGLPVNVQNFNFLLSENSDIKSYIVENNNTLQIIQQNLIYLASQMETTHQELSSFRTELKILQNFYGRIGLSDKMENLNLARLTFESIQLIENENLRNNLPKTILPQTPTSTSLKDGEIIQTQIDKISNLMKNMIICEKFHIRSYYSIDRNDLNATFSLTTA